MPLARSARFPVFPSPIAERSRPPPTERRRGYEADGQRPSILQRDQRRPFRSPGDKGRSAIDAVDDPAPVAMPSESELFSQEIVDYMFEVLDRSVPFVAIPEAHHHLLLDQPLAFISALRAVLAEWRHSKPQRGARPG